MAKVIAMNVKKVIMIALIIVVSILVMMAFYSNRHKFTGLDTEKYVKVSLNSPVSVSELADKYSDYRTRARFVAELKEVNGLTSVNSIEKDMVLIPIYETN